MSYILDALRKSEQERTHGTTPDIKTFGVAPAVQLRVSSRKPIFIYAALSVSLVVAVVVLLWVSGAPSELQEADVIIADSETLQLAEIESEISAPVEPVKPVIVPKPATVAVVPTAVKKPVKKKTVKPKARSPKKPAVKSPAAKKVRVPEVKQSPSVVFLEEEIPDEEIYSQKPLPKSLTKKKAPTRAKIKKPKREVVSISNLPSSVRKRLPSMTFSGHVYSSVAKRRSVIINDKKMREGDFVNNDLQLEEITTKAAVFHFDHYYFRLGALQNWSSH